MMARRNCPQRFHLFIPRHHLHQNPRIKMRCSLKQSPLYPSRLIVRPRSPLYTISVPPAASANYRSLLSLKALHLSSTLKPRWAVECSAASEAAPTPRQQKILDFFFWTGPMPSGGFDHCFDGVINTSINYIAYNIACKETLQYFPYPWLMSVLYLAAGAFFVAGFSSAYEPPETDLHFWMSLLPVAVANAIGHVAAIVSLSESSLYFAELMRCAEPVFVMLLSSFFLLGGKWFPLLVYLSLLPIIGGCALAAATEQNFNMSGFIAAMIANFAFAVMNILAERRLEKKTEEDDKKSAKTVTGPTYGACISILSLLIIAPFSLAIEGPRLWAAGWKKTGLEVHTGLFSRFILVHCIMYGMYTESVHRFLPFIQSFPFFTINNMKRIFLILISITFVMPVRPVNALGAAIALLGMFLHFRELCKVFVSKSGSCNTIGFLHTCCS